MRICTYRGGKLADTNDSKKGSTDLPIYLKILYLWTYIPKKIDRTFGYCTPAWLNDIIIVTRGNKQDHEKKLFDILNEWKKAGYRASKKKSEFLMN